MTAFVDLFGGVLDSNTQKVNTADILGGKVVGIYFGANWCPECRAFTQYLRDYYNHQKAEAMELVFVSLDENQRAFQSHYATMPWKALPFVDKGRKVSLRNRFVVNGHNIPKLVILDQKGLIIQDDGVGAVYRGAPSSVRIVDPGNRSGKIGCPLHLVFENAGLHNYYNNYLRGYHP
jgi:nucleoredoxin